MIGGWRVNAVVAPVRVRLRLPLETWLVASVLGIRARDQLPDSGEPMLAIVTLGTDGMPHGYCYLWNPSLVWLHVISDSLIAAAYFTIPITLVYFVRKRRDLPFNWIFVCFGVFILACGATHLMSVYNVWVPAWWLAGGVKTVTALASVPTAVLLYRLVPEALKLPSPQDMAVANAALKEAQNARSEEHTSELHSL